MISGIPNKLKIRKKINHPLSPLLAANQHAVTVQYSSHNTRRVIRNIIPFELLLTFGNKNL